MERGGRLPKAAAASLIIIAAVSVFLGCAQERTEEEALFERACGLCHPTKNALFKHKSREEWERTVNAMIARGARATPEEAGRIVDYLYRLNPEK